MKKKLLITFGILALIGIAGGIWFSNNWHRIPGIISNIKNPIAENQPTDWQDGPTVRTSDQPNIIVIMVDDLGFNEVSSYGGGLANGQFKTPNIDQLAADGVLCTNGYSASAVCSPSRAAFLTGRFATRFGYEFTPTAKGYGKVIMRYAKDREIPPIYREDIDEALPPVSEMGLPPSEITIPEILKSQGYHSVHIGKWHLGGSEQFMPNNHGFDESLWIEQGSLFLPEDHPDVVNAKLPDIMDKFVFANLPYAVQHNESGRFRPDGHLTDYLTDEAVKVIQKNKNRPFFLNLAYWAVHRPLQALQSDYDQLDYIDDHIERVQAAMVMTVDRGVGKIRQALKDNGISDNTIIIFTSDNGAPRNYGLQDINKPFRGWKTTFFEGGVHIPFIVSYPRGLQGGQIYNGRVSNVDIFSTIGALTGASLPNDRKIDGENFLPYFSGEKEGEPLRPLFCKSGTYSFLIKNGWKLQVDEKQNKQWLFDLNTDPTEQNNLAEVAQERLAELSNLRKGLLAEQLSEPIWKGALTSPIQIDETVKDKLTNEEEYIYWTN
jgi:uncharacterized sulfatase